MTRKHNYDFWEKMATDRGHCLITVETVENENDIRSGTVTIKCANGHTFTTSAHSYQNARTSKLTGKKNGCPHCKANVTHQFWKGRERPERKVQKNSSTAPVVEQNTNVQVKNEVTRIRDFRIAVCANRSTKPAAPSQKLPPFNAINSRGGLIAWLKRSPNLYNNFILKLLEESASATSIEGGTQNHHIIPKHSGGPDVDWNLVPVSLKNHKEAHALRFQVYGENGDELTTRIVGFNGLSADEYVRTIVKSSHESSRRNATGFNDSQQQSLNGQKGGAKQTAAKLEKYKEKLSPEVRKALARKNCFLNLTTNQQFCVYPQHVQLPKDFYEIFLKTFDSAPHSKNANLLRNTELTNFTSNLARMFKGQRKKVYGIQIIQGV